MKYVTRDRQGDIASAHEPKRDTNGDPVPPTRDATELLQDDDADLIAFLNPRRTVLTYREFEQRIEANETSAGAALDLIHANKRLFQATIRGASDNRIDLDSANTIAFVDALVAGGALDAAGKTAVLA